MAILTGRARRLAWQCFFVSACIVAVQNGLVFGQPGQSAREETGLLITPSKQLGVADHFFSQSEYHQAAIEYQKFLHFFPDHEKEPYARYQLAMACFNEGQYETALKYFKSLAGAGWQNDLSLEAGLMISRCHISLGNIMPAVANLKEMRQSVNRRDVRDRVNYEIAWIYLGTVSDSGCEGVTRALSYLNKIDRSRRAEYALDGVYQSLEAVCMDENGLDLPRKKPSLAAGLAIFPGAGYAYCGRFHDALVSFLFNSALMYAAYEAFDHDNNALGAVVSFVELGFYMGSIYGSATAAHKYNKYQVDTFLDHLASFRVGLMPAKGDGSLICRVQITF